LLLVLCLTVTVSTVAETVESLAPPAPDGDVVRPVARPIHAEGGTAILYGSVAPEGSVMKIAGAASLEFRGRARPFDSEQDAFDALTRGTIEPGDVIVIRYEGPKGSPGMPEMLAVTAAVAGAGLGKDVALIEDGDEIVIDAEERRIDVAVDDAELERRRSAWVAPEPRYRTGALAKYARLVGSASQGAVTS
jgi:dihydroxy-acid dehydratase